MADSQNDSSNSQEDNIEPSDSPKESPPRPDENQADPDEVVGEEEDQGERKPEQEAPEKPVLSDLDALSDVEEDSDQEVEVIDRPGTQNVNPTWKNMPKVSNANQRKDWPEIWLQRYAQQEIQDQEHAENLKRFLHRPTLEQLVDALALLRLPK